MAIAIEVGTPYGVPFTYHRIRTLQIYYPEQCVDVSVASYASKEHRENDAQPIEAQARFTFEELGVEPDGEVTRAAVYDRLRVTAPFEGASDA